MAEGPVEEPLGVPVAALLLGVLGEPQAGPGLTELVAGRGEDGQGS
ncbi:hypothetical protein [Streptomyces sp. NPDC001809]